MTTQVTTKTFQSEVLDAKTPVIVDFWADWCGPCKMMAPVFEELSKDYVGKVKFVKVDVMQAQELAQKYNVQGIPNLIIFNKGKVIGQLIGFKQKSNLKSELDSVIAKSA